MSGISRKIANKIGKMPAFIKKFMLINLLMSRKNPGQTGMLKSKQQ